MPRATNGPASRQRKNRMFKKTKGYFGGRKNLLRTAKETLMRAMAFQTRDRKVKKRTFRSLWIARVGIAARECGITYNALISGLKKAAIEIDRKMLADLAVHDMNAFKKIVETVKAA